MLRFLRYSPPIPHVCNCGARLVLLLDYDSGGESLAYVVDPDESIETVTERALDPSDLFNRARAMLRHAERLFSGKGSP